MTCTCTICALLACCSPAAEVSLARSRLRGKQGVRRYETTHVWVAVERHGTCSGNSKALSWLVCQGVALRQADPSRCVQNPAYFFVFFNCPLRSLGFYPLSRPLYNIVSQIVFTLCYLLRCSSSTTEAVPQALAFVAATVYVCVFGAQQQQEIEPRQHRLNVKRTWEQSNTEVPGIRSIPVVYNRSKKNSTTEAHTYH